MSNKPEENQPELEPKEVKRQLPTVQEKSTKLAVVVETKTAPVVTDTTQTDFEGAYQEYLSGRKGAYGQLFFYNLNKYLEKMAPGIQNTPQEGALNQYLLWHNLNYLLNEGTDSEFKRIWTIFLWKVNAEAIKGAFARTHIYRYYEAWDKGKELETATQNLIDLILQTCSSYSNQGKKSQHGVHFDLNRGLKVGFTDKARTRLTSYYNHLVIAKS